jgi:hypothetical protein
MKKILLIHPPLVKASEPPVGLARLVAALTRAGVSCTTWDANVEGQWALLQNQRTAHTDLPRTRQAARRLTDDLAYVRHPLGYENFDRYRLAVHSLDHLLRESGNSLPCTIGLADFNHSRLQPVVAADLFTSAEHPEQMPFYDFFLQQLRQRLTHTTPDYVGLSVNYLSQALCAFALTGLIRKLAPAVRVIMGGGLITSWMRRPDWHNPFNGLVDELVAGPGEEPLLRLMQVQNPAAGFPCPDFTDLPLTHYFSPGLILPYSASFGCFWNRCAFCPEKTEGQRFLSLTSEQVLQDVAHLVARHQPRLLHFTDNALSPKLLHHLVQHPPGKPWYGFTRITPLLAEEEFCRLLKKSNCVMLKLGVESGDEEVLSAMNKGHSAALAGRVLDQLAHAGVAAYIYLLFGTPWENEKSARATMDFVRQHRQAITFINPAIFNQPIEPGMTLQPFYHGDLSLYTDYQHVQGWSRAAVRRFLDREFKRQPEIAQILQRTPPFFTSNHAPFFTENMRRKK